MTEDTTTTDQAYERMTMTDTQLQIQRLMEIIKQQDWDDDELLSYAEGFIYKHGLTGQFANYLETIQREEQAQQ